MSKKVQRPVKKGLEGGNTDKPSIVKNNEKAMGGNLQAFYRVDQAALALGLSEQTVRKYAREGKLKGHKQAGRFYFLHNDIINFITGK